MGDLYNYVFFLLATLAVFCALGVVLVPNPIYSALYLAGTMIALAGLFFALGAYFVAGVQLIVYAGAVMVLFVMVVMLFDLKKEKEAFSGSALGFFVKFIFGALTLGLIAGAFEISRPMHVDASKATEAATSTKVLATALFSTHVFGFEVISILLLVVIVGAVTMARSKGGTHV
ncbi:MAG: NADH-quinone oxidoreductase subunit J [Bdellovibrionia bacterium]